MSQEKIEYLALSMGVLFTLVLYTLHRLGADQLIERILGA